MTRSASSTSASGASPAPRRQGGSGNSRSAQSPAPARDTARPLAERLGLPVLVEPALTELDFGAYEGRTKDEIGLKLRKAHLTEPIPGGEALINVWRRAAAVLDRLRADTPGGTEAVAVGHFWINRLIHGHGLGQPFEAACRDRAYRPETGSVRTLDLPA